MKNINIAFCFDKNLWKQFCVSIISLLTVSKNKCSYNIYTVISDDITNEIQSQIKNIIMQYDNKSKITFLKDNHDFDKHEPGRSAGYFYRIQLIKLAPKVDKIIYCDIDTVFRKPLIDLYNINMKDKLLYGVKDGINISRYWKKYKTRTDKKYLSKQGKYINSGVLLINLKTFRNENIYPKFLKLIGKKLRYQDQDMLNYIAKNRIGYLPLKYNFTPKGIRHKYYLAYKENLFSKNEIYDAKKDAVIWHFMACNPWKKITKGASIWWKYAHQLNFYKEFKQNFIKQASLLQKILFMIIKNAK